MLSEYRSDDRHPFVSFLHLVLLCVLSGTAFTLIAVFVCFILYGKVALSMGMGSQSNVTILKIVQFFSSVGTFVLPALYFGKKEAGSSSEYLRLNRPFDLKLALLATIIVFLASFFIEWTIQVNQMMKLPDFLKGLEDWMKNKEHQLETVTRQLLVMKTPTDLLVNLIIVAVVPAVGEEFIFRGCLQKILGKWCANVHWGIWLSAAIFSAIHIQFYGFLPRMLLGALFGYLFYWSKNLWIPVIAHFINNGTAVVGAWIIQQRGESIEKVTRPENLPFSLIAISFVFTLALLVVFYKFSPHKVEVTENEQQLD